MVKYVGHDLGTPALLLFGMGKWICLSSPEKNFKPML